MSAVERAVTRARARIAERIGAELPGVAVTEGDGGIVIEGAGLVRRLLDHVRLRAVGAWLR